MHTAGKPGTSVPYSAHPGRDLNVGTGASEEMHDPTDNLFDLGFFRQRRWQARNSPWPMHVAAFIRGAIAGCKVERRHFYQPVREEHTLRQPSMVASPWRRAAAASVLCALALALPACWVIPPKVLTTPDNPVPVAKHFPSALLAEPIQLREGYAHTTQPFTIKGPNERWTVSLGFVAADSALTAQQRLDGGSDTCWTNGPDEGMRLRTCKSKTPGFHLRWELLSEDGAVVAQRERDNLNERGGGTYSADAITRTLSGFSNERPGI